MKTLKRYTVLTIGRRSGLTLIEVVIYVALLSIFLSFSIGTMYGLLESQSQNRRRIETQEEANFLMAKIEWALSDASAINFPAAGASSSVLSVDKYGFSANPVVFDVSSGTMRLARGGGAPAALSDGNVVVSQASFTHNAALNGAPESVAISFTVSEANPVSPPTASTTLENLIYLAK